MLSDLFDWAGQVPQRWIREHRRSRPDYRHCSLQDVVRLFRNLSYAVRLIPAQHEPLGHGGVERCRQRDDTDHHLKVRRIMTQSTQDSHDLMCRYLRQPFTLHQDGIHRVCMREPEHLKVIEHRSSITFLHHPFLVWDTRLCKQLQHAICLLHHVSQDEGYPEPCAILRPNRFRLAPLLLLCRKSFRKPARVFGNFERLPLRLTRNFLSLLALPVRNPHCHQDRANRSHRLPSGRVGLKMLPRRRESAERPSVESQARTQYCDQLLELRFVDHASPRSIPCNEHSETRRLMDFNT